MLEPDDPRHGRNGYTNYDCRCEICRAAHAAYMREYMTRPGNREKHNAMTRRRYWEYKAEDEARR